MTTVKKRSLKPLTIIGIIILVGLNFVIFYFLQRAVENTVLVPSEQNFKFCPELKQVGFIAKESVSNGQNLRYYEKTSTEASGTLIFYHGSGRSACENKEIIGNLEGLPLNIILAEYPGYGRDPSGQKASESLILPNSLTLAQHIKKNLPQNQQFFIYGASLGTAVATYVASKLTPDGLILRNPTTSIFETAKVLYKTYPSKLIEILLKSHFEAFKWAKEVKTNVLILYAEKDTWIPLKLAKEQATNFNKSKVSFHIIKDADHMNTYSFPEYKTHFQGFILKNTTKKP